MYRRALIIGGVVIAVAAGLVAAQEADVAKTRVLSGTISGAISSPVAGVCSSVGFTAICPSTTLCSCVTMAAAKVTGNLAGKGVAIVKITLDSGTATSAIAGSTCQAGFGEADLTTTVGSGKNKFVKTEALNLLLSVCNKLNQGRPNEIVGGFGIASAPAPSPSASGWGTVEGTEKSSNATLKLKGSITQ
jgi:hypothetical protein